MSIAARNAILAGGGSQPSGGYWGLCFTAEQANSTVAMVANGSSPSVSLLYSTDAANWSPFVVGTTTVTLASVGDKVWLKAGSGGNAAFGSGLSEYNTFSLSGQIAASGNIMSLLDGDDESLTITATYCFFGLFSNCSSLTAAPSLPATTLASRCYASMFSGCASLMAAPSLPATTLAIYCYSSMFSGCSSLTAAPSLPATTLANNCYHSMFSGCASLTAAPSLPATTLAFYCYREMFYGCSSLTAAPSLPATTLKLYCYREMFYGCSSLTAVEVGFVEFSKNNATSSWLSGVAATGTFRCPTALGTNATITRGVSACPEGWTVINTDA